MESFRIELQSTGRIKVSIKREALKHCKLNNMNIIIPKFHVKPELNQILNLITYENDEEINYEAIDEVLDNKFIIIFQNENLGLVRDPIGYIPCYLHYSDGSYIISDRIFLREKTSNVIRLYPWHIYEMKFDKKIVMLAKKNYHFLLENETYRKKPISFSEAVKILKDYLYQRLRNIINQLKLKRLYVSYSGGVDSSLTAKLLSECGCDVIAIIAGLRNSQELRMAEENARLMKLDYQLIEIKPDLSEVEEDVTNVIGMIEDFTPMNIAIGLAQYWVMKNISKNATLAVGQGADEVYAGYQRYTDIYLEEGEKAALEDIKYHILYSYKVNFEREWKLSIANNISLLYPLISPGIIHYISGLPLKYLISGPSDIYRKRILREVAKEMGIPKEIYMRPKRSMQYSTGSMDMIRRISKQYGLKPFQYLYNEFINIFIDKSFKVYR